MESSAEEVTEFPRPPQTFTDRAGHEIRVTAYDGGPDPLADMYLDYGDESRAQGLPPRGEPQIRQWLDDLLEEGRNVVAWHEDRVVGHAVLFPYDDTAELAIFVHPEYQTIGIGSRLIRVLLGHGQAHGLAHVWLAVERTNLVAMNLYKSVGFETTVRDRAEHEMELEM